MSELKMKERLNILEETKQVKEFTNGWMAIEIEILKSIFDVENIVR